MKKTIITTAILLLSGTILFSSCSSDKKEKAVVNRTVKAKCRYLFPELGREARILEIDKLFEPNDTVKVLGVSYVVISIEREHKCIDPTHITCDGNCECDGMECPDISAIDRQLKDYQLDIYMDTFRIYDRGRFVGTFITDGTSRMDSIILADNQ